jgi:Hemerythrin HHE cation binding domain
MSMAVSVVGPISSVAQPVLPHRHVVTTGVVHRAVRRDLDRLVGVLGDPVTSVRRAALVEHTGFLLDQLTALHRLQDECLWPAVVAHRPHLADLAARSMQAHAGIAEPIIAVRTCALNWKRAPITRTAACTAVRGLAVALEPVVGQDTETIPLACAMLPEDAGAEVERAEPRPVGPTKIARRLFWLLDDLPPAQADLLLAPTPTWRLWVLRNGFSGAYNRAAYLMWIGGGNGPAV